MIFDRLFGSEECDHEWVNITGIKSETNGDLHNEDLVTITETETDMERCIHCNKTVKLDEETTTYLVMKSEI